MGSAFVTNLHLFYMCTAVAAHICLYFLCALLTVSYEWDFNVFVQNVVIFFYFPYLTKNRYKL
jgi:hypothetical protein